jgi:glycine/D-amino acid oxidase-like deaminating enzyme
MRVVRIAVIGGGLQGCGVALELSDRGFDVDLFERSSRLMQGASRHCEGKIHLGYVYAADESLRTARLMAAAASTFLPTVSRWIGTSADQLGTSTPFRYAIHRDSLRTADQLVSSYKTMSEIARDEFDGSEMVPGLDVGHVRAVEPGDDWPYGPAIVSAYETSEIAVEPEGLADAIERAVLSHPSITTICEVSVTAVDIRNQTITWRLGDDTGSRSRQARYEHIVNCSWGGLPKLDSTAGLVPTRSWSFRMKYFVRLGASEATVQTPSTTFVLGPFGDVVDFGPAGRYLSWYPAARLGFSTDLEPPDWKSELPWRASAEMARNIANGLSTVMPSVATMRSAVENRGSVRGGLIYAHGNTDLSDNETELHQRHSIGITSVGPYSSVNTGKLTTAPYFAREVADSLCGSR